jgi:hypothetical protein
MKNKQSNFYSLFIRSAGLGGTPSQKAKKQLNTSYIFIKYIKRLNKNLKYFKNDLNDYSNKHYPSATKEWYNSIYTYNKKDMRNIVVNYLVVTKLLKNFIRSIPIYLSKRISHVRRISLKNNVYMSKPELKHNSRNVIITLYIFANYKINLTYLYRFLNKENFTIWMYKKTRLLGLRNFIEKEVSKGINERKRKVLYKYKNILIEILNLEKKIDKMKKYFEDIISIYFNKAVIIKFIRLKYLYLNSNMVAEYIALKLKRSGLYKAKKYLWKVKYPSFSKFYIKKNINKNTLKIKSLLDDISKIPLEIVNEKNYNKKINKKQLLTNNYCKEIIQLIKYKYPIGIRLASAGRLTRRYRADRAVYRLYSKGIFKNIDSSFKNQSVVLLRGYVQPNVEYAMSCFKRRIGAYSAKSWLSFF